MSIKQELEELRQRALTELKAIKDKSGLAELEIKYLGRKGEIARAFKNLKAVVAEEKPVLGELANQVKAEIEQAFIKAKSSILSSDQTRAVDLTIPGLKPLVGHMHPVLQVQRDLENLFRSMGFLVLDGPELESEYYNFEALNIPSWHPARDTQDTFYVKGGSEENRWLLRTHTSNMQVRALEKYGAPLRVVVPGRVFRYEATDASHDTQFWQMEGLVVDKDISISHLIATMKALLTGIFQREVEVRLRPGYFPFVEPGFELDIKCLVCDGDG
ncbi:MAG: phenylalanine--tRNA ligase subunit alpha, partial [Candidatus Veblenbacteria bacterium RIFOXYB1_FULL_43_13]